jgi:hypothetical protein
MKKLIGFLVLAGGLLIEVDCSGSSSGAPTAPLPKVYAIDDTGPSGVGTVFYITNGGVNGLEAAPSDQGGLVPWDTGTNYGVTTSLAVGSGASNTGNIIAAQGSGTYAASVCASYIGGGKKDWYLPSIGELNLLYANLKAAGKGGFTAQFYWSSSQETTSTAWGEMFSPYGDPTGPGSSTGTGYTKSVSDAVRPIRSF